MNERELDEALRNIDERGARERRLHLLIGLAPLVLVALILAVMLRQVADLQGELSTLRDARAALSREIGALEREQASAREERDRLRGEVEALDRQRAEGARMLRGDADHAFTEDGAALGGAVTPKAECRNVGASHASFKLWLEVAEGTRPRIRQVTYRFDRRFYVKVGELRAESGPEWAVSPATAFSTCTSNVLVTVETTEGQRAELAFDWCRAAGWSPERRCGAERAAGSR